MSTTILGVKSNGKMKRMVSRKSHSWWWDSHISPKNSKWLADNLEEMDHGVKEMLKLIEEEGDSFAKKAEMYYQKRPVLISHVEDFYRMYRALAERYDQVTGELRKAELHSQGSGSGSDFGSEPPSPSLPVFDRNAELKPAIRKPSARAAGFQVFLGSGGSSDFSRKGSDGSSSSSECDSDSDDAKDVNGSGDGLQQRILELENELFVIKEKLSEHEKCGHLLTEEHGDLISTISLENDLLAANRKLQNSESEIASLHQKLMEKNLSTEDLCLENTVVSEMETQAVDWEKEMKDHEQDIENLKRLISAKDEVTEQYKTQLADASEKFSQEKLHLEADVVNLKGVIEQLKSEIKKISQAKSRAESRLSMQQNLIEEFKATAAISADRFSLEKSALKSEISILSLSNTTLSAKVLQLEAEKAVLCSDRDRQNYELNREIEPLRVQVDMLTTEKDELLARVSVLKDDIKCRDDRICQMDEHMYQLHQEHVKLIAELEEARIVCKELSEQIKELDEEVERQRIAISDAAERKREARIVCKELSEQIKELDEEVERQRIAISDAAECKREAIRQLCFSLEHYRDGYHHLLQRLQGNNKRPAAVMAV